MTADAELRDLLDAAESDDAEPDDINTRPRLDVDPRTLPVRISRLKKMGLSPAHYREGCRYGDGIGETLSLKMGNAADAIAFDKPRIVWDKKTKAGKASPRNGNDWKKFQADHPGKVIMTPREEREASGMVTALQRDSRARGLLFSTGVRHDVDVSWECLGRKCSSHIDALSPVAVVDLKTARSAEPERFQRQAYWLGYHAQLAFYVDACKAAGFGERDAYIVAVESAPPYPVTVFQLYDDVIDAGRRQYRLWFERLLACEAANEWPGYAQSVVRFTVPDMDSTSLLIGGEEVEL